MMIDPKDFENAIDGIRQLVKQLITLSTGIIALTITFSKDFISVDHITDSSKYLVGISWLFLLISIVFGILSLMAISGLNIQLIWGKLEIGKYKKEAEDYPKSFRSCMLYFGIQVLTFTLALIFIIIYGFILIKSPST